MLAKAKPPYKNNGTWYSKALFYEQAMYIQKEQRVILPSFTLNADMPDLINFGREYVADMDTTGYKTANRLLGSFIHFQQLLKSPWFKNAKAEWDAEIEAIIESKAIATIRAVAADLEDKNCLQAAKFLASKQHKKQGSTRGRPTAIDVQAALKAETEEAKTLNEDAERVSNLLQFKKAV